MKTREYKLYKASELNDIQFNITEILNKWSLSWVNAIDVMSLDTLQPIQGDRGRIRSEMIYKAVDKKGRCIHFLVNSPVIDGMCKLLFGADLKSESVNCHKDGIANDVIKSSLKDLAEMIIFNGERVADTEFVSQDVLPKEIFSPGFGSVLATLYFNEEIFWLICSKEALKGLLTKTDNVAQLKPRTGLDSVKSAISNYSVKCRAKLGEAEISCEDLVSLQVGDVIQLEQKLEEPVSLVFDNDLVGCKGFLGKLDSSMAIKVRAG